MTDSLGNATGIPVSVSNATDVTEVSFTLTYDPTLLTIASSGALTLSAAATAAGINTVSYSITPVNTNHDLLTVSLTSTADGGLTSNSAMPLVTILASVPDTAPYLDKAVLNLGDVVVNGTSAAGVSGVEEAAYLGNVSGSGNISALDASLVNQVGSGSGTGFSAFKDLDPAIIGGVSGGTNVSALDASLINQAGAGATIAQIPSVPNGITPTFGGPDPYLYLGAVQGSAGQTVTETLYLDVTDPNGIQLTALDEAIGFDAGELQISDVRGASGLVNLGSYGAASTADSGSGVLLVGQAFAGSGLPPVVPYGTDVPVLQFNVKLNADLSVGSEISLTLLQDGTINGQTKYTAISDNEGALSWTPGMAPTNFGNAAVDGSVTVVPTAAPVVPEAVVPSAPRPVVVLPKVIEPVRRVAPLTAVSKPVTTTAVPVASSVSLVAMLASGEAPTLAEETAVANVSPLLQSQIVLIQPEATVVGNQVTGSPGLAPEAGQFASVSAGTTRASDPGASLSLVAIGTNKAASTTSSLKTSTSVLDEMYRQLGVTPGATPVNGTYLGAGGKDDAEEMLDVWFLDDSVVDLEIWQGRKEVSASDI